jgi:hypothetical protein
VVKGAIKEGSKKGGRGGVRSRRLKTQLKAQDEDKRRQLGSGLCYTHYDTRVTGPRHGGAGTLVRRCGSMPLPPGEWSTWFTSLKETFVSGYGV